MPPSSATSSSIPAVPTSTSSVGPSGSDTLPTPESPPVVSLRRRNAAQSRSHGMAYRASAIQRQGKRTSSASATLHQVGPYSCSQSMDITTLTKVLAGYFGGSQDTLHARSLSVILNVHHASSTEAPDELSSTLSSEQMPSRSNSIATLLDDALGPYIFTPEQLRDDRLHLSRWTNAYPHYRPAEGYFNQSQPVFGQPQTTPDGWPSTGYVEMERGRRLLLGWGSVDPQMRGYDFSADRDIIFHSGSLSSVRDVSTANGSIGSGCLLNLETMTPDPRSSWVAAPLPNLNETHELSLLSRNFSACGISPLVNSTLFNKTADVDIEPYRNISLSSVWSWSADEPHGAFTATGEDGSGTDRCAVMDLALSGGWRATDCNARRYAACRVGSSPYQWRMSSRQVAYHHAPGACPEGTTFGIPRTGLENSYLYSYLRSQPSLDVASETSSSRSVWVDFNSIDVHTCWVTDGASELCPYHSDEASGIPKRRIIIPTIAAVVVLLVAALTLFVKCNANRRNSRRRRVIEGWEYEGVPS
jgi:hypothetical protein